MPTTPEHIDRHALLPLLEALGLVPEEIAELTITPLDVTVSAYLLDNDGRLEVADGEPVVRTIRIPIAG